MRSLDDLRQLLRTIRHKGKVAIGWVILIVFIVYVFNATDEGGWIPHTGTLDLRMTSNWITNESRICSLDMSYRKTEGSYLPEQIRCPFNLEPTETHTIPVRFWGRISRPSVPMPYWDGQRWVGATIWRCKREGDSFTCYALS